MSAVVVVAPGAPVSAAPATAQACLAHHANSSAEYPISYAPGCTGHDEPELDPVSSLPGSARDLTWTAVLPTDGTVPVSAVGPTFWWGGTVTDPDPFALYGQGFLELQFYPDAIVQTCTATGGFRVTHAPNAFSVCSPVWQVNRVTGAERAAFNAELFDGRSTRPLVMHGGDTIQVHFFVVAGDGGWHVHVTDLTTGHAGTIVLNGRNGPLLPEFDSQKIGDALGWGIVNDTPNSFVWEIGHTSDFTSPPAQFCLPGQQRCDSYDVSHWLGFSPLEIKSVTFAGGSSARRWAVVSDFGGITEVQANCRIYGGPYCSYPWFTFNGSTDSFNYGADYPGTAVDYGQAAQFATTELCGGPGGADSTYCDRVLPATP